MIEADFDFIKPLDAEKRNKKFPPDLLILNSYYTPENQNGNGESPCLIGDKSANCCFPIVMLVFGGENFYLLQNDWKRYCKHVFFPNDDCFPDESHARKDQQKITRQKQLQVIINSYYNHGFNPTSHSKKNMKSESQKWSQQKNVYIYISFIYILYI